MLQKYPFFKRERKWKLLRASLLEFFFIAVIQPLANYLIYGEMNIADLFSIRVSLVLLALFAIYVVWKLWEWYKEDYEEYQKDEELRRNDLLRILNLLHTRQVKFAKYIRDGSNESAKEEDCEIGKLLKELKAHESDDIVKKIKARQVLEE